MIEFVKGDLLTSDAEYIAQGVAEGNQEGLGTGLALKISKRWPDVQAAFKKYARSGKFKGGKLWVCEPTGQHPGIIYLATQPDMYHATVPYVRKAMRNLAKWSLKNKARIVALPKIGAGLGKLSWIDEVKPIMLEHLVELPCRFVVYEEFVPEHELSKDMSR